MPEIGFTLSEKEECGFGYWIKGESQSMAAKGRYSDWGFVRKNILTARGWKKGSAAASSDTNRGAREGRRT